MMNEDKQEF